MERTDLTFFYMLGTSLNVLTQMDGSKPENRIDILLQAWETRDRINNLYSVFNMLTVCRTPGENLIRSIDKSSQWFRETAKKQEKDFQVKDHSVDAMFKEIIDNAKQYEVVLLAEIQTLANYHVTQKGIYSTPDLIERAEKMLPESVLERIPEKVMSEIQQSGRCLAFDNPTASGFHILRATEVVLYQYYLAVCKPEKTKTLSNWGAYIRELRNSTEPDVEEAVSMIQQVKDNERNLIMHPERVLSTDDAFRLFEVAKAMIITMSTRLPEIKKEKIVGG